MSFTLIRVRSVVLVLLTAIKKEVTKVTSFFIWAAVDSSWICSTLVKFRLCGSATVGSIHSLSGFVRFAHSIRPQIRRTTICVFLAIQHHIKRGRINLPLFIWAAVDSNHRPHPYQASRKILNGSDFSRQSALTT